MTELVSAPHPMFGPPQRGPVGVSLTTILLHLMFAHSVLPLYNMSILILLLMVHASVLLTMFGLQSIILVGANLTSISHLQEHAQVVPNKWVTRLVILVNPIMERVPVILWPMLGLRH